MSQSSQVPGEAEAVIALSDPGEVGRADHNRGDRIVVGISNVMAWIFPILMIAICAQVILRQAGHNQAWLDDLQWWLYGIAVLSGIAYAVTTNSHVRVDILYDNFERPKQYRINIYALGWLFLPFIMMCWDITFHYMIASIKSGEGSSSPNGLHNLWILKILMNVSFLFIAFAIVSAVLRYLERLRPLTGWNIAMSMLPAVIFAVNIVLYYGVWWAVRLTSPAEVKDRQISRTAFFDEVEILGYDMSIPVLVTLALTALLLIVLRMRASKEV